MDMISLTFKNKIGDTMIVTAIQNGYVFETNSVKFTRNLEESAVFLTDLACKEDPDFAQSSEKLKVSHKASLMRSYTSVLVMLASRN